MESRDEPHAIPIYPLGWIASGGRSPLCARATKVLRAQTCVANNDLSQYKLDLEARDREIAALTLERPLLRLALNSVILTASPKTRFY